MAKKSVNLLVKVAVVIAVIGAVFFALDTWRKKSGSPETAETTESTAPAGAALSREEAERIGTEVGTRIGTEIGTQIGREVAAEMLAARAGTSSTAQAPSEQPAVSEPAPVAAAPSTPTPAVEPATPAVAEPTVADTAPSEPETTVAESTPTTPTAPRRATTVQGRDTWWTKSNTGDPDALVLSYAGDFKSNDGKQSGIALMFAGRFDAQTDFSFIAPGKWELGATQGLIYLPRIPPGTYTVTVKAGFKDADGKTVKSDIKGPVTVK